MDRISGLPEELLVKIITFVPTKVSVSTSILSKRWESLWKLVPKLECDCSEPSLRDFIFKNLQLRAPIIESLCLKFRRDSFHLALDIKLWVGTAVSRCLRELSINDYSYMHEPDVVFPSSLYTCESLVTLKLEGSSILVDVPQMACLPSLKTLQLRCVTYSNHDSLRLLLSCCPVLEDLVIEREQDIKDDKVRAIVIIIPSLQRLSLTIDDRGSNDKDVIITPSLKYFKVEDDGDSFSNSIEHMPELEEADINVKHSIESVTSVKRLTLRVMYYEDCLPRPRWSLVQSGYRDGIVFHQLEQLKLSICNDYWSKFLVWLLKNSPKLRVLSLYADSDDENYEEYEPDCWKNIRSSDPECLKSSLETFEFAGYSGRPEERDFLSFIFQKACCLKSSSILRYVPQ